MQRPMARGGDRWVHEEGQIPGKKRTIWASRWLVKKSANLVNEGSQIEGEA